MNILSFSETVLRYEVTNNKRLFENNTMKYSVVGTGLNLLTVLTNLGHKGYLHGVIPSNNLNKLITTEVHKYNVKSDKLISYGNQIGSYILEKLHNYDNVTYQNRLSSSHNTYDYSQIDVDKLLADIDVVHICGIAFATSVHTQKHALQIAKTAHEQNKIVIFDFNFREDMWTDESYREIYQKMIKYVTIVSMSIWDANEILQLNVDNFEQLFTKLNENYNVQYLCGLKRETIDKNNTKIASYFYSQDLKYETTPIAFDIVDRIGTGDAHFGYIINMILREQLSVETLNEALLYCKYAHQYDGDVTNITIEEFNKLKENKIIYR